MAGLQDDRVLVQPYAGYAAKSRRGDIEGGFGAGVEALRKRVSGVMATMSLSVWHDLLGELALRPRLHQNSRGRFLES